MTALGHHADDDLADAGSVRDRRARHAREDQRCDDVDVTEPAAEAAHGGHAELQQPLGDGAGIHDVGGDDEQRHGEQDEALVEPVHQHLAGNADALAVHAQIDKGRNQDGIGDRQPDAGEKEQGEQAQGEFECHLCAAPSCPGWSMSAPWRNALIARQP